MWWNAPRKSLYIYNFTFYQATSSHQMFGGELSTKLLTNWSNNVLSLRLQSRCVVSTYYSAKLVDFQSNQQIIEKICYKLIFTLCVSQFLMLSDLTCILIPRAATGDMYQYPNTTPLAASGDMYPYRNTTPLQYEFLCWKMQWCYTLLFAVS